MKAIDFSPQAKREYKKMCKRLDYRGQSALRKTINSLESKVYKSLINNPPNRTQYNYMTAVVQTLVHEYEIIVAGWICDCCGGKKTEVAHIEEYDLICMN